MKILIYILIDLIPLLAAAQEQNIPIIKSNTSSISIRDGNTFRPNSWTLAPEYKPDVYNSGLINGKSHKVTFYTDIDSISFFVELGKEYDFIILHGQDSCYTQIKGINFTPRAIFSEEYQQKHSGKFFIEIPEVYELVNVAIAITPFGVKEKNFIFKKSAYYKSVRDYFDKFQSHPFVSKLDSVLSRNSGWYATLKMNGNAFEFDENNKVVNSPVYERTGFGGERTNNLRPYFKEMQSFALETNFREFYSVNTDFYQSQIKFYKDTANVLEMKNWLDNHFPGYNDYDTYKIVFSPLVSYNQSTSWFESNGFKELQPHVNFPYLVDFKKLLSSTSKDAVTIYRGNIVFTEINHGYINPEADKYGERIRKTISNRNKWVEKSRSANYYRGNSTFNEYMNWGLVILRILDYVPKNQQIPLIERVERMMVNNRGFIHFREYNEFMMKLYKNRGNKTLADLYPQIIEWFAKEN